MGRAQQRVDLERRRKTLEAELDDVMRRIQLLKSLQMQDLEEGRIPVSFTCDGASVYLHTQMRASVGDGELAALLKRPEFKGDHLPRETINANSLSAWIRGFLPAKVKVRNEEHLRELLLAPDPAPFPPELLPHIGLTLVREVRVTGAGNGAS